jgi:hypothetical protein
MGYHAENAQRWHKQPTPQQFRSPAYQSAAVSLQLHDIICHQAMTASQQSQGQTALARAVGAPQQHALVGHFQQAAG